MDRPRRSTRQSTSGLQSPAQTPAPSTSAAGASSPFPNSANVPPVAMANGNAPSSRFEAYASPAAFQPGMSSHPGPNFVPGSAPPPLHYPHQPQHMSADQGPSQLSLQSLPNVHLLGRGAAPIAPGTSVAPPRPFGTAASAPTIPQAMYSTFPSRIKAGTTNLLQSMPQSEWYDPSGRPLDPLATPTHESAYGYAGGSTPHRAARASGRRRAGFVRYAEAASSDDDFDDDGAGTEDDTGSRGAKRRLDDDDDDDSSRAYLGQPPPASKVVAKRVYHRTNHVYHNDDDLARQAGRNEILVPIKIELEAEQYRIKDSFTWNMNERLVSPNHFAKLLLEDLDLPLEPYAAQITNMIQQQIEDATGVADIELEPAAGGVWASARLDETEGAMAIPEAERGEYDVGEEAVKEGRGWDWGLARRDEEQRRWRRRMAERLEAGRGLGEVEDDLRVIVDYEVQILRHMLRDRLEWDLCSPLTPESFARKLCDDLGLAGEAQTLIANSVREQLIHHKRAALELGLAGSGRVLKLKQAEMEHAWAELHADKMDKQRKRLERAGSASESQSQSQSQSQVASANATGGVNTREPSVQPSGDEDVKRATEVEENAASGRGSVEATEATGTAEVEEEEEDVETLHLTATATAVPTREGTSTPALQAVASSVVPTRTSARLSNMLSEAAGASSGTASGAATPSGVTTTAQAGGIEPVLSASQRLHNASYTVREILSRGPRPLEGIWRDWHESREFGPLLERLNDDDLDKLEEANIRASRRNRRDAARAFGGRRRRYA